MHLLRVLSNGDEEFFLCLWWLFGQYELRDIAGFGP